MKKGKRWSSRSRQSQTGWRCNSYIIDLLVLEKLVESSKLETVKQQMNENRLRLHEYCRTNVRYALKSKLRKGKISNYVLSSMKFCSLYSWFRDGMMVEPVMWPKQVLPITSQASVDCWFNPLFIAGNSESKINKVQNKSNEANTFDILHTFIAGLFPKICKNHRRVI